MKMTMYNESQSGSFLQKYVLRDLVKSFLWLIQVGKKAPIYTKNATYAILLILTKSWKQLKCQLVANLINKL
jgi:hypothetical protein